MRAVGYLAIIDAKFSVVSDKVRVGLKALITSITALTNEVCVFEPKIDHNRLSVEETAFFGAYSQTRN